MSVTVDSEPGRDDQPQSTPPSIPTKAARPPFRETRRAHSLREVVLVVAFYYVYQTIRSVANHSGVERRAFANASLIVDAEKWLHIFVEQPIQQAFLGARWFLKFWNIYYGTLHFAITAGLLIWVFLKRPESYRRMRNLLGATTGLALIGYWSFPLAPPRMIACNDSIPVPSAGAGPTVGKCFVDTLDRYGGLWSYQSPVAKAVANPFAAMPSLHFGWALWCGIVFALLARHGWSRAFAVLYPLITLFAIVVTANHYLLDAAGGALVLLGGVGVTHLLERNSMRRALRRSAKRQARLQPGT
ncbi:MAG TPA: phosphatase PAP2 family protein [Ilumatobacteraceae bacterium]|nr:phosphatase PAP2 family protein [Ilumatobacteraceae bacterium]